jgi:hypothetical protein
MTVFWDVMPCSLVDTDRRFRGAVSIIRASATSVNIYQSTRLNIAEDSHLHIRRRENLKSHRINELLVEVNIFC